VRVLVRYFGKSEMPIGDIQNGIGAGRQPLQGAGGENAGRGGQPGALQQQERLRPNAGRAPLMGAVQNNRAGNTQNVPRGNPAGQTVPGNRDIVDLGNGEGGGQNPAGTTVRIQRGQARTGYMARTEENAENPGRAGRRAGENPVGPGMQRTAGAQGYRNENVHEAPVGTAQNIPATVQENQLGARFDITA